MAFKNVNYKFLHRVMYNACQLSSNCDGLMALDFGSRPTSRLKNKETQSMMVKYKWNSGPNYDALN